MDAAKVDLFIMTHAKSFETHQLSYIREKLLALDDSQWIILQSLNIKDPMLSLIVSIVGGHFGIDRFLIGDIGLGIGKLITCGGLGVWTVIDWFLIMDATRSKNFGKLQPYLF
ncbi:TM2 domain-containing protein [Aquirufa sp. KTFRIE-69F]|uniref:TM2 domain-containing protein n=1 Tax=Aquirufa originis TaxID=3096514 RepID=A0ABW6D532_9BACT